MSAQSPSRRVFLQRTATALGGAFLGTQAGAVMAAAKAAGQAIATQAPWQNLSGPEAAALAAVTDQIFPPDGPPEPSPGASELGAVHFIDAALGGFMAGAAGMLRAGIADLDERAATAHGSAFADLGFEQQTGLLQQIENSAFFGTLHFLTLVGLFALPRYGGNGDGRAWQLIGFESRHVWSAPYGYYDAEYAKEQHHAST